MNVLRILFVFYYDTGKVLEGEELIKTVEAEGSNSGTPKKKVTIVDSGEL